jgi:hypothetical protein
MAKAEVKAFFDELPFTPPLFTTAKGDAVVHLMLLRDGHVAVKWLASLHRGAGRAALALITAAADRHGVTLELTARPQRPAGEGKKLSTEKLEAFYAGFGFVSTGCGNDGFAHMVRAPQ